MIFTQRKLIFVSFSLCLFALQSFISVAQEGKSREQELEYFQKFACRTIKEINIRVINPAGTSLNPATLDTLPHRELIVNKIHSRSGWRNVKKLLLFREKDWLEPSVLVDCQRNLRQNGSYNDALIVVDEIPGTDDVKVTVIVQDNQSLAIATGLWEGRFFLGFNLNNFLNLGHRFGSSVSFNYDLKNPVTFRSHYSIPNLFRTRFNLSGNAEIDRYRQRYGFEFERNFVLLEDKWAARVESFWNTDYTFFNNDQHREKLSYNFQDAWVARSFKVGFIEKMSKYSRLITSIRAYRKVYGSAPSSDTYSPFKNNGYVLASIGIANLDYYQTRFIYYFGNSEYLPKGVNFSIIGGMNYQQIYRTHCYLGLNINFGKLFRKGGYIFTELSNGNYISNYGYSKGVINTTIRYITPQLKLAEGWGIREFIKIDGTFGIRRPQAENYSFKGLQGAKYDQPGPLVGAKGLSIRLETVVYDPLVVLGFKSNAFFFASFGVVGQHDHISSLFKSRVFQGFGTGLRLSHSKLALNFVELSFAWYPTAHLAGTSPIGWGVVSENLNAIQANNLFSPDVISAE
ncbi:MAG: hypothetical protein POELPBGB_00662 [Bacteroidia bacterium]|nr:hypothetical protein [Bacteroidia bacterium]